MRLTRPAFCGFKPAKAPHQRNLMRGLPLPKAAVCCEQESHEHQQQDGNEDSFHTVPLPLVCATSIRRRGARRAGDKLGYFSYSFNMFS